MNVLINTGASIIPKLPAENIIVEIKSLKFSHRVPSSTLAVTAQVPLSFGVGASW